MTRIRGKITDFGGSDRHSARAPIFEVIPAGVTSSLGDLLSTVPIPVDLGPNMTVDFTLRASALLMPPTPVAFRLTWLDREGNFTRQDVWDNIWIPETDSSLSDLIGQRGVSAVIVVWQATEPSEREMPIGGYWVNTVTGDVKRRDR